MHYFYINSVLVLYIRQTLDPQIFALSVERKASFDALFAWEHVASFEPILNKSS